MVELRDQKISAQEGNFGELLSVIREIKRRHLEALFDEGDINSWGTSYKTCNDEAERIKIIVVNMFYHVEEAILSAVFITCCLRE